MITLASLPHWKLKVAATLLLAGVMALVSYLQGRSDGAAVVQSKWNAERALIAHANATAEAQARAREQALAAQIDTITKEHDREIDRVRAAHQRIVAGLRERAERPTALNPALPAAATAALEPAAGCTGAELYREDGAFLAGEAARADAIRSALMVCLQAYEAARTAAAPVDDSAKSTP